MEMPKKSKYNLNIYAHLKVPKSIYERLVKKYGKEDWAESMRIIVENFLDEEEKKE